MRGEQSSREVSRFFFGEPSIQLSQREFSESTTRFVELRDDESYDGESDVARTCATPVVFGFGFGLVVPSRVHGGAFARDDVDVDYRRSRAGKTDDDDATERVGFARSDGGARDGWLDRSARGASGRR